VPGAIKRHEDVRCPAEVAKLPRVPFVLARGGDQQHGHTGVAQNVIGHAAKDQTRYPDAAVRGHHHKVSAIQHYLLENAGRWRAAVDGYLWRFANNQARGKGFKILLGMVDGPFLGVQEVTARRKLDLDRAHENYLTAVLPGE